MPALINFANVVSIQLDFVLGGTHAASSKFFYEFTGASPTAGNLNALSTSVSAAFGTDLAPYMHPNNELTGVIITDLSSSTAARGSWSGSIAGTSTGNPLPVDTALCMNSVITRRYRGGKPKLFLPFGVESNLNSDDDTWTTTFLGLVNGAWVTFKTALQGITGDGITLTQHCNCSFYDGFQSVQNPITKRWRNIPQPRTSANAIPPDPISSTTGAKTISVQRRRRFTPA